MLYLGLLIQGSWFVGAPVRVGPLMDGANVYQRQETATVLKLFRAISGYAKVIFHGIQVGQRLRGFKR